MEAKNEKKNTKTQVFNVIILDRSGSMSTIRKAAINGFNETLACISLAQDNYAETQEHYVTLATFCSCGTKYVFDRTPVKQTHPLMYKDYEPCCTTPLYDAMGFTITRMRDYVKRIENAVVVVTIITDGYENASHEYTGASIKALVESLKEEGWSFTYMGANQDAVEVSLKLSIRNARNFSYDDEGTDESMRRDRNSRSRFYSKLNANNLASPCMSKRMMADCADEAFDEEEAANEKQSKSRSHGKSKK